MTDSKTIVITWNDTRPGHYGEILAALWMADGTDDDLNTALSYARRQYRDGAVHTFPTDDPDWKRKALAAHSGGGI